MVQILSDGREHHAPPPPTHTHTHTHSPPCLSYLRGATLWCRYFPMVGSTMHPTPHKHTHTHTLPTHSQLFVWGNFMVQVLSPYWGASCAHTHFPSFLQCPVTGVLLPWQHSFMCLWFDAGGDRSTRLCLLVLSLSWFSWMPLLPKEISLLVSVFFCTVVNEMLSVPV